MEEVDLGVGNPGYSFWPQHTEQFYLFRVLYDFVRAVSLVRISVSFSKKCGKLL